MAHVTYRIVEHDGGWAYKSGDTYSETFASHDDAKAAAVRAARWMVGRSTTPRDWEFSERLTGTATD